MEGKLTKTDKGYELRYSRILKHPVDKVWEALSKFKHLNKWLNVVEFEPKVGGKFNTSHDGILAEDQILKFEPPYLLEHTWWKKENPKGVVKWRLEPYEKGCRLTLTYSAPVDSTDDWGRDMTGWHIIIELLTEYLNGVAVQTHQRPKRDSDGKRIGGTGVYAEFQNLHEKYSKIVRASQEPDNS